MNNNTNDSIINVVRGPFRLTNIVKLVPEPSGQVFTTLPVEEGLAVEYNCNYYSKAAEPNYIVLILVKYDKEQDTCKLEPVGVRCLDYVTNDTYSFYRDLVRIGFSLVNVLNKELKDADEAGVEI